MTKKKRTDRLNSLLKEVLSDVIRKEVNNPQVNEFFTVTQVDITKDLRSAKVHISVLGTDIEKKETLRALNSASGFIGKHASKQVVMRFFPSLTFYLDESVEKLMRMEELISEISTERHERNEK